MESLSITIHKDIREFKPKLIGQFTSRQVVCFAVIAVIFFLWKTLLTKVFGLEHISYIPAIIPALIPAAFGWGDMLLGMPVETYFGLVFTNKFVAMKHRKYKIHNYISIEYDKLLKEKMEEEEKEKEKIKGKKKPAKIVGEEYKSCD